MLKFSILFIIILGSISIFGVSPVTKYDFYYAFGFSFIFTNFWYLSEILKSLLPTTAIKKNRRIDKYDLISFNDAVAKELLRIRLDLIKIKLKQDAFDWMDAKKIHDKLGCTSHVLDDNLDKTPCEFLDSTPTDFLRLYLMYCQYPHNAWCGHYQTPNGNRFGGKIIIIFDKIDFDEEDYEFDAQELRKINSLKIYKFKKGMNISVYIYEPEIYGLQIHFSHDDFKQHAKILSIEDDGYILHITLEIDSLYSCGDEGTDKITRKIEIANHYPCHFSSDKKLIKNKIKI